MIYALILVGIFGMIGLAAQQNNARNERRQTLTEEDRAELGDLRDLRDRLADAALTHNLPGEHFPVIVLDEIRTTGRAIEERRRATERTLRRR